MPKVTLISVILATTSAHTCMAHGSNYEDNIAALNQLKDIIQSFKGNGTSHGLYNSSGVYTVYFDRSDGVTVGNGTATGSGTGTVTAVIGGYQFSGQWRTDPNGEGAAILFDPQGDSVICSYGYNHNQSGGTCSTNVGIPLTLRIQ